MKMRKKIVTLIMCAMSVLYQNAYTKNEITINNTFIIQPPKEIFIPSRLEGIQLLYDGTHYLVVKNNELSLIDPNNVESILKNMTLDELSVFLGRGNKECFPLPQVVVKEFNLDQEAYRELDAQEAEEILAEILPMMTQNYIVINQSLEGEYSLKTSCRLCGGGVATGVATYWMLRGAVYAISWTLQAAISVTVSCTCSPVAGVVTGKALHVAFAAPTEALAQWIGIAGAVALSATPTP